VFPIDRSPGELYRAGETIGPGTRPQGHGATERTSHDRNSIRIDFHLRCYIVSGYDDVVAPAKAAYLEARDHFAERLALDWQDSDTRANVELIQRRLKSIADIEEQRTQDEGQERSDEGEPENQDNPDSQDQDANGQKSPGGEQSENAEPKEGSDDSESEGEQQESAEPDPEEAEEGETSEPKDGEEPEEVHMSKEEMQRLLDNLKDHGATGEQIMKMNRQRQRQTVEKDW